MNIKIDYKAPKYGSTTVKQASKSEFVYINNTEQHQLRINLKDKVFRQAMSLEKIIMYLCGLSVNDKMRDEHYNENKGRANLGEMIQHLDPVACRELAILGHILLVNNGYPSEIIIGKLGEQRHAWLRLLHTDSEGKRIEYDVAFYFDPTMGCAYSSHPYYKRNDVMRIFAAKKLYLCDLYSKSGIEDILNKNQLYRDVRDNNIVNKSKCAIQ